MARKPDRFALLSGVSIAALGLVLYLDAEGSITLSAGWIGVAVCVALGVILCASALISRDDSEGR